MLRRVRPGRLGGRLFPRGRRFDPAHPSPQHKRRYFTEANVIESSYPCVDIPHLSITEFVWEHIDRWHDRTAVVCGVTGRKYTYRQLREKCRRFGVSVRHMGLEPGSRLGVIMPNTPDYPVAVLGALEAGLVITLFNDNYLPGEISTMLLETNPRALVCLPVNYAVVVEAVRLAQVSGYERPSIIVAPSDCSCAVPHGAFSLELMTGHSIASISMPRVPVDPCTVAVIPFSSGTSGVPKGVALSHRNLIANTVQIQDTPELTLQEPTTEKFQDAVAGVLPFSHIYGFHNVIVATLRMGNKVVTLSRFNGRDYLNMLKQHSVTILPVVPSIVSFMLASCDVIADSLRSCRQIVSGAAPVCPEKVAQLVDCAGQNFRFTQGYGLSEASVVCLSPFCKVNLLSVGKLLPNTRAKVVHVGTGKNLGPNEHGELCFQGPQIMLGYYNNTKATEEMIDKSGWLHTGDVGYYDECRYFFVVDRMKDLIKVKGLQVAPAELEACLRSHPDVIEAAVVGVPCVRNGEVPFAFVSPKDQSRLGCKELEASVKAHVKASKAEHKHLSEVRIVPAIPKNISGKIMRRELKELAMKKEVGDKTK